MSLVNLISIGGLTISALLFSSSGIVNMTDHNAENITAGSIKAFLEVPMDEIRAFVMVITHFEETIPPNKNVMLSI